MSTDITAVDAPTQPDNGHDTFRLAPGQHSVSSESAPSPDAAVAWWRRISVRRISLGIVVLLAAWIIGSATGFIDPQVLPAPWTAVVTGISLIENGRLTSNLLTSVQRAGIGLGLGIVIAVALALVSGLSRLGESLIDGPMNVKRAVPTLAFIPLAIVWLGIGEGMKVTLIVFSVMVPIYINTHAALRGLDGRYKELALTLDLSHRDFIARVALPGALPGFFTGLRLAVTSAWTSLVVVEQINATSGIGFLMNQARLYGQIDIIVVGLVVYAILGVGSDLLVRIAERRALTWRQTL
ncbi:ABC transporter permease [Brevibacterium zhoupengii]|uniref:ABC transporter permease n=1 Tax=Brevibacterium zhoupengii TaxID=2898795 RepID=UPI001E5EFB18|nr:ABC transporter permease [Brevibacterium zhoupengii]